MQAQGLFNEAETCLNWVASVLQGHLLDQAALRGLLNRLADLGAPLLEVVLLDGD
jgi:hypothetical protein